MKDSPPPPPLEPDIGDPSSVGPVLLEALAQHLAAALGQFAALTAGGTAGVGESVEWSNDALLAEMMRASQ